MWSKSYSKEKPLEAEKTVDERYIIRRNIKEEVSGDGEKSYSCEECIVTNSEYLLIQRIDEIELKREANIVEEYTLQLIEEGVL